ncbi:uncharacterized protein LOC108840512 [Raphanus sativus]|uniref:Uncharacterized protein LOC108840512 n=1 Tax=Raphanus sativus TaxID=3726 RepID=A0A6J0M9S9_RAPSA|nr:uncharacterized protein LOC108840512 [Raphanus sativus]
MRKFLRKMHEWRKTIEGFVDEEENHNDEVTPQNSDCEDDERHYQRYKKGSGVLTLGQAFDSLAEFKEAVVDYSLKEGFNVKFTRWGSQKSEVRCAVVAVREDSNNSGADVVAPVTEKDGDGSTENQSCPFRIYCSFEKSLGMYLIKTFEDEHSCIPDGYSTAIRDHIIAKLSLNEIRRDPKLKPKAMQAKMEEKYNVIVSNDQCRKAKQQALRMVRDEHDAQFARLKDYKMEVIKCNPDSTVELGTLTNESGKEIFDRIYVCLAPLKRTWTAHCRPIFGIDGCFLKSNEKGQFLAAVGRDANNQLFPIAWAVVEVENTDSWLWFIQLLKLDLNLLDGTGFTLISDRQKVSVSL